MLVRVGLDVLRARCHRGCYQFGLVEKQYACDRFDVDNRLALMGGLHLAIIFGAMVTASMLQLRTSSNTDLMEFFGYSFPWFLIGGSIFNTEQLSRLSNYGRDSIHPFTIATIHVASYFTLAAIGFDLALQSFKYRIARADDQQDSNTVHATTENVLPGTANEHLPI